VQGGGVVQGSIVGSGMMGSLPSPRVMRGRVSRGVRVRGHHDVGIGSAGIRLGPHRVMARGGTGLGLRGMPMREPERREQHGGQGDAMGPPLTRLQLSPPQHPQQPRLWHPLGEGMRVRVPGVPDGWPRAGWSPGGPKASNAPAPKGSAHQPGCPSTVGGARACVESRGGASTHSLLHRVEGRPRGGSTLAWGVNTKES
jgi:hypothetical protein